jgi:hypothetical protein
VGTIFQYKQVEIKDDDRIALNFIERKECEESRMGKLARIKSYIKDHCSNMIVLNLFAVLFFFAMTINLYLVYSDYKLEFFQKQSLFEAQKYIRSYRKAYVLGNERFSVKGREFAVKEAEMFVGTGYLGADSKTKCNFQIIPRVVDGELKFRVPSIPKECVEHITKEKDFNKIRKMLRVNI